MLDPEVHKTRSGVYVRDIVGEFHTEDEALQYGVLRHWAGVMVNVAGAKNWLAPQTTVYRYSDRMDTNELCAFVTPYKPYPQSLREQPTPSIVVLKSVDTISVRFCAETPRIGINQNYVFIRYDYKPDPNSQKTIIADDKITLRIGISEYLSLNADYDKTREIMAITYRIGSQVNFLVSPVATFDHRKPLYRYNFDQSGIMPELVEAIGQMDKQALDQFVVYLLSKDQTVTSAHNSNEFQHELHSRLAGIIVK